MRTLTHLALLVMLAALIVACESEGGGTYDPDAGSGSQIVNNTDTGAGADAPADQSSGDTGQLPTECAKSAPGGASCNPYCQQGCDPTQHCSHNSGTISCMSYSGQAPGAGCASSLFCEAGSACLTLDAEGGKICHQFCVTNEDCWAGAKCTLSAWVEVGLSGEIMSFCQVENDGPPCEPQCVGKQCGDDGCGATCGICGDPEAAICNDNGQCVSSCTPNCAGKECGSDGCEGSCGTCGNDICNDNGQCVSSCTPNCAGKECGSDGCDGTCGNGCTGTDTCQQGVCVCVPETCGSLGKECGNSDDGCDGYIDCGSCNEGYDCDIFSGQCLLMDNCEDEESGVLSDCLNDTNCNEGEVCEEWLGVCVVACSSQEDCCPQEDCSALFGEDLWCLPPDFWGEGP